MKPVLLTLGAVALGAIIACGSSACTSGSVLANNETRGTFDRTLSVTEPADVHVQTGSGSIRVHSGTGNAVIIHAEIRASWRGAEDKIREIQQNPPIEQNGNSIRIGRTDSNGLFNRVSISYDITVPGNTNVEAHSGSGSVKIADVKGPVNAHTGSGSVEITNTGVDVQAGTGSGSIRLNNVSGRVQARTGSGSINATGDPTANWTLRTGSGSVTAQVPPGAAFDVRAHTGSGSIRIEHAITTQGEIGKHHLEGKVRGGGPLVDISTGSGSVHIGMGGGRAL